MRQLEEVRMSHVSDTLLRPRKDRLERRHFIISNSKNSSTSISFARNVRLCFDIAALIAAVSRFVFCGFVVLFTSSLLFMVSSWIHTIPIEKTMIERCSSVIILHRK